MNKLIYADNAATTQLDEQAYKAMQPYLLQDYANASQPYSFARSPKNAVRGAREVIASCINAQPDEIYFTSGGTESDNWALNGITALNEERGAVITDNIEHHAILNTCESIEKRLYPVAYLTADSKGVVTVSTLAKVITDRTKLVSIMTANNEVGSVQPIKDLCSLAHTMGAIFHTDAVQAVGHIPVDVKDLGVDMLSASAHKFNGPKGIGFLYIKRGIKIAPFMNGGSQENGLRAGTENVASIVGMAAALKNNTERLAENIAKVTALENLFMQLMSSSKIEYIRNGAQAHIPGNISLSFKGTDGEMLLHRLDLTGIAVSTGAACDSKTTQVSHVIQAINVPEAYAKGTIRISLSKYNTEEDVRAIAAAIEHILKK